MIRLWRAEYQKTRRRYLLLLVFGMAAVTLLWALGGRLSDDARKKGWYMLLYQMPLLNALTLPLLAMLISSRLGDLEHKNNMLSHLCCITERGKLYDVKLFYGFTLILAGIFVQWCGVILDGKFIQHFGGSFMPKEYFLLLLFTIAPTAAIYVLQHAIAICCAKPAAPYIVGIVGEFAGVLSMFLPYRWFSQAMPWGYYGELMFIGSEYDRETRISAYFFREVNWAGFAAVLIITLVIYLVGKIIFCKKEI